MQQHRRLHGGFQLAAGGPYPFGSGLDGAFPPEAAKNEGRAPHVVVLNGRDEIVLKVRPAGVSRDPLLKISKHRGLSRWRCRGASDHHRERAESE